MNIRLQTIKALSILLLLSVSASSYSMQQLRNALGAVYPPIIAVAGLGTVAYQMYTLNYSKPNVEQSSGKMIVVTPAITDLPIAAPTYVVPVEGQIIPTENRVIRVNGIKGPRKQLTWADAQGKDLQRVNTISGRSVLAKFEDVNALKAVRRPSNAAAMYKGSLAQSKRTPSRRTRSSNQVALVASQEAVPFVAIGAIAAQRSDATLTKAQAQISQFNRLAQEAQAARAAQVERTQKAEAEKKQKRQAVNFYRPAKS